MRFIGTLDGVEILDRAFNRVSEHVSDFRFVWPSATTEVYQILNEQFESEGAAGATGRWAKLSPAYEKWKTTHYPGQPILRLTDALFESLTSFEGLDSIYQADAEQLTIGSKAPYAKRHQKTRPIFAFKEEHKRRITKSIQLPLAKFVREQGFVIERAA